MKKMMLRKFNKTNFICAFAFTGLVIFIGGCATPKLLDNRGSIPPATLTPSADANEIAANMQLENNDITLTGNSGEITDVQENNFPDVKTEIIVYKVKKGDSFWKIARMYSVGINELAAHNNMDLKKTLKAGAVLEIPPGGKLNPKNELISVKSQKNAKKLSPVTANTGDGVYTVKSGDSLWLIARMHNTNVNELTKANGINKKATLRVGQKLILPKGSNAIKTVKNKREILHANKQTKVVPLSKADNDLLSDLIGDSKETKSDETKSDMLEIATSSYLPHTIKEGDSWNTISEMYGVSIADLKKANPKIASAKEPKVASIINIPED